MKKNCKDVSVNAVLSIVDPMQIVVIYDRYMPEHPLPLIRLFVGKAWTFFGDTNVFPAGYDYDKIGRSVVRSIEYRDGCMELVLF